MAALLLSRVGWGVRVVDLLPLCEVGKRLRVRMKVEDDCVKGFLDRWMCGATLTARSQGTLSKQNISQHVIAKVRLIFEFSSEEEHMSEG